MAIRAKVPWTGDVSALVLATEADRLRFTAREVRREGCEAAAEILQRAAAFIEEAAPAARTSWRRAWRVARRNRTGEALPGLYGRACELLKQREHHLVALPHHTQSSCEECRVPAGTACLADCPARASIRASQGPRAELRQCGGRSRCVAAAPAAPGGQHG